MFVLFVPRALRYIPNSIASLTAFLEQDDVPVLVLTNLEMISSIFFSTKPL